MEWLAQQGPLGALCLALVAVIRRLYNDLSVSKENERLALLHMLNSERSEESHDRQIRGSRSRADQ